MIMIMIIQIIIIYIILILIIVTGRSDARPRVGIGARVGRASSFGSRVRPGRQGSR